MSNQEQHKQNQLSSEETTFSQVLRHVKEAQKWEVSAEVAAIRICRMITEAEQRGREDALSFVERKLI